MANQRKKKKKNAQASKQAAAAYKGKKAVAKPVAAPKKDKPVQQQKPVAEKNKAAADKAQNNAKVNKVQQKPEPTAQSKKPKADKKKNKCKSSYKEKKAAFKKKLSSADPKKVSSFVLVSSVVVAVISVVVLLLSLRFTVPDEAKVKYMGRNLPDSAMLVVADDLAVQYEFTEKMERKGDTKKFRYYASDKIVFPEKYSTANLNLVNVFDNECVFIASIVDEGSTVVYQSLGLPAGRCLADIAISDLPYGTQEMKLVVAAYDPESYELIGVQYSDLTVQVGIEEEITNEQTEETKN